MTDSQVGERLGYGITLILSVEVGKVVYFQILPVCGELLFIEVHQCIPFKVVPAWPSVAERG